MEEIEEIEIYIGSGLVGWSWLSDTLDQKGFIYEVPYIGFIESYDRKRLYEVSACIHAIQTLKTPTNSLIIYFYEENTTDCSEWFSKWENNAIVKELVSLLNLYGRDIAVIYSSSLTDSLKNAYSMAPNVTELTEACWSLLDEIDSLSSHFFILDNVKRTFINDMTCMRMWVGEKTYNCTPKQYSFLSSISNSLKNNKETLEAHIKKDPHEYLKFKRLILNKIFMSLKKIITEFEMDIACISSDYLATLPKNTKAIYTNLQNVKKETEATIDSVSKYTAILDECEDDKC